jgi:hypothetical protein
MSRGNRSRKHPLACGERGEPRRSTIDSELDVDRRFPLPRLSHSFRRTTRSRNFGAMDSFRRSSRRQRKHIDGHDTANIFRASHTIQTLRRRHGSEIGECDLIVEPMFLAVRLLDVVGMCYGG